MIKKETKITQLLPEESRSQKNMIKGNTLRQNSPRKLVIKELPVFKDEVSHGSIVEPIMENGLVVGIYHHCRCGGNTEIRFELEKSTPDEIIES